MSVINFERPVIKPEDYNPIPYEGKSFPYNMVADDRRFEELVYSIYRARIDAGTLLNYDDIGLMSGVRDEGRDCVLYKSGKIVGLIQCKQIDKSLTPELVGKEITKFALYSILHPELIYDRSKFEYIISVSKGFTNDCHKFIDDFSAGISEEPRLSRWITEHLKQPALLPLQSTIKHEEVLDILIKIKITKVQPPDLDRYLMEPGVKHIISLFFQVRSVTDNSEVEKIGRKIDQFISRDLGVKELEKQLQRGSASLNIQSNQLDHVPDSHILRTETQTLYDWVLAAATKDELGREKNICLLAGEAGIGKTVILKDLYDLLGTTNIPVLALKADKLYPTNMVDLQQKVSLSLPVSDFIDQCRQRFDKTVILIDQIDALSQSMSSDRNFLHVFRQLIDQLMYDSNIRIIVSVRIFDLNYDPSLKVYKHLKAVKVGLLSEQDVYRQLDKIGVSNAVVSPKLLELLRTPNHLNVFTTIFTKSEKSLTGINSLQELYLELWMQKIVHPTITTVDGTQLKHLLYQIAQRMFNEQRIALSQFSFEADQKELAYLESERLIRIQDKQIQFFHQSFYDFVFAKSFVEEGQSIIPYILAQKQTILIRAAVKMILNYLRTYDPERYIKELNGLLRSDRILFHIKHLVVSMLAVLDEPTEAEYQLFRRVIVPSKTLSVVFFEHSYNDGWSAMIYELQLLNELIHPQTAVQPSKLKSYWAKLTKTDLKTGTTNEQYYRHVRSQFLRKQLAQGSEDAFDFALKIEDANLIRWLIVTLNRWDSPKAFQLLAKAPALLEEQNRDFYHIMESVLEYDAAFVLEKVKDIVLVDNYFDGTRRNDLYNEKRFLRALADKMPKELVGPLLANLHAVLDNPRYAELGFNGDFKYKNVSLGEELDEEFSDGHELLYKMLALSLRYLAVNAPEQFRAVEVQLQVKTDDSYLRLLIFAYSGDPQRYTAEVIEMLKHLTVHNKFREHDKLSHDFRALLEQIFSYFNQQQRDTTIQLIRNLRVPEELFIHRRPDIEKPYAIAWGVNKYFLMKSLPQSYLRADSSLWREFLALERKFSDRGNTLSPDRPIARPVGRPLSPEAYQKMRAKNWIKSFRKYDNDISRFNDFIGGMREHSWAFNEFAKIDPEEAFNILTQISLDPGIQPDYKICGLYGLTFTDMAIDRILPFVKLFIKDKSYQVNSTLFLSVVKHIFIHDCYDDDLITFVVNEAVNAEVPDRWQKDTTKSETSIDGLVTRGINSAIGKAADCLMFIHDSQKEAVIFEAVSKLLKNGAAPVRAVLYWRFAHLMRVDDSKVFNLFTASIAEENDPKVLASSLWTLQYMVNHDFNRLRPLLKKLISIQQLGHDDRQMLGSIIFISYLKGHQMAGRLYKEFLDLQPKARSWALHDALEYFYLYSDSPAKCLETLFTLIGPASQEIKEEVRFNLYKLESVKFSDVRLFLAAYIKSKDFRLNEDLVNYLTVSCNDNSFDCIDLFNKAIKRGKTGQDDDMLREEDHLTQFIIEAYNGLKGNDRKSDRYRQKLLRSFDKILIDHRFRNKAENILEAL